MAIAHAFAGETVDAICWRTLGRTEGVTEQTLALNPGLCAGGPKLAEGQAVQLPEIAIAAPATRETVNLWS